MEPLVAFVKKELKKRADPEKAPPMARYMKNKQAFLGVQAPFIKEVVSLTIKTFPQPAFPEIRQVVKTLWNGTYREERHSALRLAERWKIHTHAEALELCEWMIRTGAWWDLVDTIATRLVGQLVINCPETRAPVFGWIDSENLWLRRTALLTQLKWKKETDEKLLGAMILKVAGEQEFFIQKAIGWALREYGKTNPEFVKTFVQKHQEILSPLSKKEALKHLM